MTREEIIEAVKAMEAYANNIYEFKDGTPFGIKED